MFLFNDKYGHRYFQPAKACISFLLSLENLNNLNSMLQLSFVNRYFKIHFRHKMLFLPKIKSFVGRHSC